MDRKRYSWYMGKLGEKLFQASNHMSTLLSEGCIFIDGHAPDIPFSNLDDVRHLDVLVYEPTTKRIRAIYEVRPGRISTEKSLTRTALAQTLLAGRTPRAFRFFS